MRRKMGEKIVDRKHEAHVPQCCFGAIEFTQYTSLTSGSSGKWIKAILVYSSWIRVVFCAWQPTKNIFLLVNNLLQCEFCFPIENWKG